LTITLSDTSRLIDWKLEVQHIPFIIEEKDETNTNIVKLVQKDLPTITQGHSVEIEVKCAADALVIFVNGVRVHSTLRYHQRLAGKAPNIDKIDIYPQYTYYFTHFATLVTYSKE